MCVEIQLLPTSLLCLSLDEPGFAVAMPMIKADY